MEEQVVSLILQMQSAFQASFDGFLFKLSIVVTLVAIASAWFQYSHMKANTKEVEEVKRQLKDALEKTQALKKELEDKTHKIDRTLSDIEFKTKQIRSDLDRTAFAKDDDREEEK